MTLVGAMLVVLLVLCTSAGMFMLPFRLKKLLPQLDMLIIKLGNEMCTLFPN